MKKMVVGSLVLIALAATATPAGAWGWRRHDCGSYMTGDCGAAVAYVEQTVTAYRPEYKTRVVPMEVTRMVSKVVEQPYKYTEMVPVVTPQKRTETFYTTQTKEVPFKYTEMVPVVTPQKRTETFYTTQTKE